MKKTILVGAICLLAGAVSGQALAERQPFMRAALRNLEQAKEQLQKASADKGGHRAKAIDLVSSAIDEVKAGIEHDNKN
ncbi:MAG: hypothetical protein HYV07_03440 [Deltaproteobacteria bacterium]|nr:hypothetical protein [Deltaproteobacteria bacterium]